MTDVHTDGNGVAGLLGEVLAVEATQVMRRCQSCGDESPLGAHRAYEGAGMVLRPSPSAECEHAASYCSRSTVPSISP
jgi:hypothetical protein